jgi:hypothetical protein
MEKKFGSLKMIKSIANAKLRKFMMDEYMYGLYQPQSFKQVTVMRNGVEYQRQINETRSHVSYKQFLELNHEWHDRYDEEYNRLKREGKIKEE